MVKINSYVIKKFVEKNKKKITWTSLILAIVFLLYSFLKISINPIISQTIEIKSRSLATRAMNSAIAEVVSKSIIYDDIVKIVSDENGNISLIQANALEVNGLSRRLAQATEIKIEEYGRNGVSIPLGSFTGIPVFVGLGPQVRLRVNPIGAVNCTFSSKFENAGINQTNHKIYLTVNSTIGIIMPLLSIKQLQSQQVLLCESIIVGNVPEVYLYSDNLDNLLNFVPM